MADVQFHDLQLVGFREPDYSTEENPDKTKFNVELPGVYRVGFQLGDRFMEIATFKAGNVMDQIAQADSSAQAQPAEAAPAEPSGEQSQSEPPAQ
jgi:hypothetical protein